MSMNDLLAEALSQLSARQQAKFLGQLSNVSDSVGIHDDQHFVPDTSTTFHADNQILLAYLADQQGKQAGEQVLPLKGVTAYASSLPAEQANLLRVPDNFGQPAKQTPGLASPSTFLVQSTGSSTQHDADRQPVAPSSHNLLHGLGQFGAAVPVPAAVVGNLPNSLTVTSSTDCMRAAGFINAAFSQPGSTSFMLKTSTDGTGGSMALNIALKVAVHARKLNLSAGTGFDMGFVPFLLNDGSEHLGLLIYRCSLPTDMPQGRGQVLKVEAESNPLVAGLSLLPILQSATNPVELIFSPEAAKVAMQTISILRINLTNTKRDILLLPQTELASGPAGNAAYFHVKLTPTTQLLPTFQHQLQQPGAMDSASSSTMPPAGILGMPVTTQPAALPKHQPHSLLQAQYLPASSNPPPRLPNLQQFPQLYPQGPLPPAPAYGMVAPNVSRQAADAAPAAQRAIALPTLGHTNIVPQLPLTLHGPLHPMPTSGAGAQSLMRKSRKADEVIVTEETAIKNAAGAVAKVLGRVTELGQCCPVYTERKTDSFTTVISVAVKAIAVSRGYVCNEGTGHEVGFQPFVRHGERQVTMTELQEHVMEKKLLSQLKKQGVNAVIKSIDNSDASCLDDSFVDDQCEVAFDVFKVMVAPEITHAGMGLPVKVTAHSRPNVVSNIITKLVMENDSAVVITAGGKAMHVAMTAAIGARAKLRSKGFDIMLLPKFVTVDTTNTLGWESVFLRFRIVKWAPALISNEPVHGGVPQAAASRFIIAPA